MARGVFDLRDEEPGFDHTGYERDCPHCDGRIIFHWSELRDAPRGGKIVHIVSKCLTKGCGNVDRFNPAISEEIHEFFDDRWYQQKFFAWKTHTNFESEAPEATVEFTEEEQEEIEGRLEDLGYF